MFFGDSGSIAGGTMRTPSWPLMPCGTYCCMCQTVASYSAISGSRRSIGSGFGSERSMWQRQIQRWRMVLRAPAHPDRLRVVDR